MSEKKTLFKSKNGWSLAENDVGELEMLDRSGHRFSGNRGSIRRSYRIAEAVLKRFHADDAAMALLEIIKWNYSHSIHTGVEFPKLYD